MMKNKANIFLTPEILKKNIMNSNYILKVIVFVHVNNYSINIIYFQNIDDKNIFM